jgi:hypothetical protein
VLSSDGKKTTILISDCVIGRFLWKGDATETLQTEVSNCNLYFSSFLERKKFWENRGLNPSCEISGSHGDEYEDKSFLGCTVVRTASIIALMEAVRSSETSVYSSETTRLYIPEGSNLLNPSYCIRLWDLTLIRCDESLK